MKEVDTVSAPGPILKDGLAIRPRFTFDSETVLAYPAGADVFQSGELVFTVNEIGRKLLNMADGTVTLDEMAESLELTATISEVGMFFVKLGQAGFLKNRVEIELYENKNYMEVCV
jgi:hypothetical protein